MYCFWYRLYYSLIATQNTKSVEAILRLCYMDTDSFIVHVKLEDVEEDLAEDVETRFNTSNYQVKRSLPIGKNNKVIWLMKEELSSKVMK